MSLVRIKITPYECEPKHFDKRYHIQKCWYNKVGDTSIFTKFHPFNNRYKTKKDWIKEYDLIQNPKILSIEDPLLGKLERSKVEFEIHSLDGSVTEEVWYFRDQIFSIPHTEEKDISSSPNLDEFIV